MQNNTTTTGSRTCLLAFLTNWSDASAGGGGGGDPQGHKRKPVYTSVQMHFCNRASGMWTLFNRAVDQALTEIDSPGGTAMK